MRFPLIIGLLLLSVSGCITQPKQTLQANVPAGLDRGDVELAILLATGLSAPDNGPVASWQDYVSATLRNAGDRHVSRLDEADDEDRWVFDTADGKPSPPVMWMGRRSFGSASTITPQTIQFESLGVSISTSRPLKSTPSRKSG